MSTPRVRHLKYKHPDVLRRREVDMGDRVWLCVHNEKSDECVQCELEWNPMSLCFDALCPHEEVEDGWCVLCGGRA